VSPCHPKQPSPRLPIALLSLTLLFCAARARADVYDITIINATFSATCIGSTGTCTEVVNGSILADFDPSDPVASTVLNVSMQLTGTLTASLNGFYNGSGTNPCSGPNCLLPDLVYDTGAISPYNPIEFSPSLPTLDAPTPEALDGGNNTLLFVPSLCGGDQPSCGTTGSFPGGADYELTSGTYTSVAEAPEPSPVILLAIGAMMLGFPLCRRGSGHFRGAIPEIAEYKWEK
jgi:hypothetical protein